MMAVAADLPVATDFIGSPLKATVTSVRKYLLSAGKGSNTDNIGNYWNSICF